MVNANRPTTRIAVVCLGNICRSPMADVILSERIRELGLDDVTVDSFGTAAWHAGNEMDPRAAATLTSQGYDATRHRARHFTVAEATAYDLVLAMDETNHADLAALGVPPDTLHRFRDFDPEPGDRNVPDPYYGGEDGFREVLEMVERTAAAIARQVAGQRAARHQPGGRP